MQSNRIAQLAVAPADAGPTSTSLLERVRLVIPDIEARVAETERARMVPAENIRLLKETGLHKVFLPKAYGGYEASLPEFTQCLVEVAGACASTGWAFGLMCTHNYMIAHFAKRLQDEVWGRNPDATASSSIASSSSPRIATPGALRWLATARGVPIAD